MTLNKWLLTSVTDNWATPQDFFDDMNKKYNFTLDPCADDVNHKCDKYYTKEQDWLAQDRDNEIVFMNPPYGREIGKRVKKALQARGGQVVCLLPARTDTKWFHEYVYRHPRVEMYFLRGRLKFWQSKNSAPFPSGSNFS